MPAHADQALRSVSRREINNQREFVRCVKAHQPDLIYFWNMAGVSISLVYLANKLSIPVCFYVSDDWFAQWKTTDAWFGLWQTRNIISRRAEPIKWLVANLMPLFGKMPFAETPLWSNMQFTSRALLNSVVAMESDAGTFRVLHWGVDADNFHPASNWPSTRATRFLFAGQIRQEKGIETVLNALERTVHESESEDISLTIAGGFVTPDYETHIRQLVTDLGIEGRCQFLGKRVREEMPAIYREHDVLIFPSIWEEPFSIALLEGMASGLAVIGTQTGGTKEILINDVNAITFGSDNVLECAASMTTLASNPVLYQRLAHASRDTVVSRFQFSDMVDKIETMMKAAVSVS